MNNDIMNVGAIPLNRGPYTDHSNYYKANIITMCSCIFRCDANQVSGMPPLTLKDDGSGDYEFANTSVWTCVMDNLELYNRTMAAIEAIAKAQRVTTEMEELNGVVTNAENIRIASENQRLENETERKSSEATRKANEIERISNEDTRKANEIERISYENTRRANETKRNEAELLRIAQNELCVHNTNEAKKASELAYEIGQHPTYIGENGFWMVWNVETDAYEESDDFALGDSCFPHFSVDPENMLLMIEISVNDEERFELAEDGILYLNY